MERIWSPTSVCVIFNGLRFDGIIFSINVVYDLEVLVQIDTACAMVDCYCIHNMMQYKLDLSASSQQWGPHFFDFFWQAGHAQHH